MAAVLVLLPAGAAPPALPDGVEVRTCATPAEAVAALAATTGDVVLCVDGLGGAAEIAEAVASVRGSVIQVEQDAWDGEAHSPVSAACRGVVAGFGVAGVVAAVALLGDGA